MDCQHRRLVLRLHRPNPRLRERTYAYPNTGRYACSNAHCPANPNGDGCTCADAYPNPHT